MVSMEYTRPSCLTSREAAPKIKYMQQVRQQTQQASGAPYALRPSTPQGHPKDCNLSQKVSLRVNRAHLDYLLRKTTMMHGTVFALVVAIFLSEASHASGQASPVKGGADFYAQGQGKGPGTPRVVRDPSDIDPTWYKKPPPLGGDSFGSKFYVPDNSNIGQIAQHTDPGHRGSFWDYWKHKTEASSEYGHLRGPTPKSSQRLPYLTLRDSFGMGNVVEDSTESQEQFEGGDFDLPNPDAKPGSGGDGKKEDGDEKK